MPEDVVKFSQLTKGQFKYFEGGNICTVFKRDDTSITIRRADGWLITVNNNDWSWDRDVILLK